VNEQVLQSFSEKWNLEEQVIFTIFRMIQDSGRKYGKTARALKKFNIQISVRQLKHFYRKANEE